MRIAVMVISLVLMLVVFVQSCTVSAGGELVEDEGLSQGGAVGVLVALLFLIGGALVLAYPLASVVSFGIGAVIGVAAGATTDFTDLVVWGVVSAVLSVMAYFGYRGKRRDALAAVPARPTAGTGASEPTKECPECAEHVQPAAKVCRFCGHRFDDPAMEGAELSGSA